MVIVAGEFFETRDHSITQQPDIRQVRSCREVQRLLDHDSGAHLIYTDVKLPDGDWCDILRLVVNARMCAEVRVLGAGGRTLLRIEVEPRHCCLHVLGSALHDSLTSAQTVVPDMPGRPS